MGIINKIKNLFKKSNKDIVINSDIPAVNNLSVEKAEVNNLSVNKLDCSNVEVVELNRSNSEAEFKPICFPPKRIPRLSEKQILKNHRIAKVMFYFNIDSKKAREYLRIKQIEKTSKKIRVKKKQLKRIQKLFRRD